MATPSASTDVLDITDLDKVLSVFKNSHFPDNQWDDLGLKLGITKPKLETIRVDKQDSKDCLKECLSCWLYQNYDTDQYGKPTCTMESLAAALRGMGLTAVAERLDLNTPSTVLVKPEAKGLSVEEGPMYPNVALCSINSPSSISDSKEAEIPVKKSMREEFISIRASFAKMMYNISKAIARNSPPLDELKEFLYCYSSGLETKLDNCDSVRSVVQLIIRDECSLTDIELLEAVVEHFGVTEAERYIEEYKRSLKEFCESLSISLRLKEKSKAIETSPLKSETATYVFDWRPDEKDLQDITDILAKISDGKLVKIKYIDTN